MSRPQRPRTPVLYASAWALAVLIPLIFLGVFFAWPAATLIARGFIHDSHLDLNQAAHILTAPRTLSVVRQTLTQALIATTISALLALPSAFLLYRRRFPGWRLLRTIIIVPFVLPSVVVGVAFHAMVTRGGPLESLNLDGTTTAVIAAMVFFNYGFLVRNVGSFWAHLDPRPEQAARSLGAGPIRVFLTVTLPSIAPALAGAASVVFLFCATAYGVVLVLGGVGVATIETEIYRLTAQFLDLPSAAVLSVIQILIIALALWSADRARRASQRAATLRAPQPATPLTTRDLPALIMTLVVIGGLLAGPMVFLLIRSLRRSGHWTLANYTDLATTGQRHALLVPVWEAAWNSLTMALAATMVAMVVGTMVALVVSRSPRSRWLRRGAAILDAAFMLPLGVSAVTVGFGFLITLSQPPLAISRTWWIVPLAQAVVAVPLVVRTLLPALRGIDPRQRQAAASLGASPWRVLATVDGPHLLRSGGLALGFALATSVGEFGATSFLARPQTPTLPVVIYRLIGSPGATNQGMAMAASIVLALTTSILMMACELASASSRENA